MKSGQTSPGLPQILVFSDVLQAIPLGYPFRGMCDIETFLQSVRDINLALVFRKQSFTQQIPALP